MVDVVLPEGSLEVAAVEVKHGVISLVHREDVDVAWGSLNPLSKNLVDGHEIG